MDIGFGVQGLPFFVNGVYLGQVLDILRRCMLRVKDFHLAKAKRQPIFQICVGVCDS